MSFTVTKVDIWSSKIEDKPGGLAKVLAALGDAGASLECVIARRDSAKSGAGVVFLTPAKGAAVRKAAQSQRCGTRQEPSDVESRRGRCCGSWRSDRHGNCRCGNKLAGCFRGCDRKEICGVPRLRQCCRRDESGSRVKDSGQS